MPVEFLRDQEVAAYGRFTGVPSRPELERAFFLDDVDKELTAKRRGDHNRLGFALQLTTVRWLGTFLSDPLDVPDEVVAYLAEQLGIAEVSCARRYTDRRTTRFEHAEQITDALGLVDFSEVDKELEAWVDARAWTTGDRPEGHLRRHGQVAGRAQGPVARCEHAGPAGGPGARRGNPAALRALG